MRKPVFRFQIAALAGRSRSERRRLISGFLRSDPKLLRYNAWAIGLAVGFDSGFSNMLARAVFGYSSLATSMACGLLLALPLIALAQLFLINPRLQQLLDR